MTLTGANKRPIGPGDNLTHRGGERDRGPKVRCGGGAGFPAAAPKESAQYQHFAHNSPCNRPMQPRIATYNKIGSTPDFAATRSSRESIVPSLPIISRGRTRREVDGLDPLKDYLNRLSERGCPKMLLPGEGGTPPRTLPAWRYPMGSRFTPPGSGRAQIADTQELRAPIRIYRRFGDLFGMTSNTESGDPPWKLRTPEPE